MKNILHNSVLYQFSKYSSRNTVPNMFKNPKFTRQGIQIAKKKEYVHDLTQPHIQNVHLYYDAVQHKQNVSEWKQIKSASQKYQHVDESEIRPYDQIQTEMIDKELLQKGSFRGIRCILELERHHQQQLKENLDLVQFTLKSLSNSIQKYSFREFVIFSLLIERYLINDKEVATAVLQNLQKFLKKTEYYNRSLVSTEKLQDNFAHVFRRVCRLAKIHDLNLEGVESSLNSYYKSKLESFDNVHNQIMYTTSFVKFFKENQSYLSLFEQLMEKVKKTEQLNGHDILALLDMLYPIYSKEQNGKVIELVSKYIKLNKQMKLNDQAEAKTFTRICGLISQFEKKNCEMKEFKKFAKTMFSQNKGMFQSSIDMAFLSRSLFGLSVADKEMYTHLQEVIVKNNDTRSFSLKQLVLPILTSCQLGKFKSNYSADFQTQILQTLNDSILKNELNSRNQQQVLQFLENFFSSDVSGLQQFPNINQYLENNNVCLKN